MELQPRPFFSLANVTHCGKTHFLSLNILFKNGDFQPIFRHEKAKFVLIDQKCNFAAVCLMTSIAQIDPQGNASTGKIFSVVICYWKIILNLWLCRFCRLSVMACMLRQPFSVREPLRGSLKIPISTILHMLPKVGLTLRYQLNYYLLIKSQCSRQHKFTPKLSDNWKIRK